MSEIYAGEAVVASDLAAARAEVTDLRTRLVEAERQRDALREENEQMKKLLDLKLKKASDEQVSQLLEGM